MPTARTKNDVLVGLSIVIVGALLIAGVLWLRQADLGRERRRLVARTRDVGSLQVGNPVVIRGVRAGTIQSIALGGEGWVAIDIKLDREVELPPEPAVLLYASSLFGEWQAMVTSVPALPADRALQSQIRDAAGRRDTLPAAMVPDIAQLTAVAGRIAGDVANVAERVRAAFDDTAAFDLRGTIRDFASLSRELSRTVNAQSKNLDRVSTDAMVAMRALRAATDNVQRVAGRVDSTTSRGELAAIVSDVQRSTRDILTAAGQVKSIAGRLDRTGGDLERAIANADTLLVRVRRGEGTLGLLATDASVYRNTDSLLIELRALVRDVKANPKRYVNVRIF
ncbi:MAG: MlaD family protein [Gemmatimonadaceae bacterium]|nr:MlaD family protein [Gemmatimonadaceae bacterium]